MYINLEDVDVLDMYSSLRRWYRRHIHCCFYFFIFIVFHDVSFIIIQAMDVLCMCFLVDVLYVCFHFFSFHRTK